MTAQDMIAASQLTRVRELQTQLKKAAEVNARLAAENAELKAHLDLALLAAEDLRTLPAGGRLVIVDGWNVILGARPRGAEAAGSVIAPGRVRHPDDLIAQAKRHLAEHPSDFVWIVFDGPRESVRLAAPRLRISYTGGVGPHRADAFICDFLRMARFRGALGRIVVETRDKDFKKEVVRLALDSGPQSVV